MTFIKFLNLLVVFLIEYKYSKVINIKIKNNNNLLLLHKLLIYISNKSKDKFSLLKKLLIKFIPKLIKLMILLLRSNLNIFKIINNQLNKYHQLKNKYPKLKNNSTISINLLTNFDNKINNLIKNC
jgi:hypothetical protein